jgi:hypothetical protein
MEPLRPGQRRAFRLWSVLLALLALLTLIAFSSGAGFGHTTKARPTSGYVNWAVSIFLVVFVLMIPFAIYAYWIQTREWRAKKERTSFQSRVLRGLAVLAILLFVGFLIGYVQRHGLRLTGLQSLLHPDQQSAKGAHGSRQSKTYEPRFQWPVLWGTILVLAAGVAYVLWRRRGAEPPAAPLADETIEEAVAASLDGALDDLQNEPDARRAVIAAYARMESVLARHGLRRRQSETSLEYLQRILLGLTSRSDAVVRLTGLFERAKFSRHEIDGAMKNDAIDALRAIRDDLRPAEV